MTEARKKLESLTVDELRSRAKAAGHSGLSRLKKAELVDLLLAESPVPVEEEAKPAEAGADTPEKSRAPAQGPIISSALARLLQLAGSLGLILSVALALALPLVSLRFTANLADRLTGAADAMNGVAEGINVAGRNLESGAAALDSGSQALRTANRSLQGMDPLLDSVGELLADELPGSIEATQDALISAQDGAAAMDRVLRGLRLLGLNYDPELPLDQSLAQTADSLQGLPQALRQTEQDLAQSQDDLAQMGQDLTVLARNLDVFSDDLRESAAEIQTVTDNLDSASAQLTRWGERMPSLRWLFAAVSFAFGLWLVLLHLNLYVVGRMAVGLRQQG